MTIKEIKAKILVNEMYAKASNTQEEKDNYNRQVNYYKNLLNDYLTVERLRAKI